MHLTMFSSHYTRAHRHANTQAIDSGEYDNQDVHSIHRKARDMTEKVAATSNEAGFKIEPGYNQYGWPTSKSVWSYASNSNHLERNENITVHDVYFQCGEGLAEGSIFIYATSSKSVMPPELRKLTLVAFRHLVTDHKLRFLMQL